MENPTQALIAELSAPAPNRQILALTGLLRLGAGGRDLHGCFRPVVDHCLRQDNALIRKLALEVVGYTQCSLQDWMEVGAILQRNIQSEDSSLRTAALEAVLDLPPAVQADIIRAGGDALETCLDSDKASVREAACNAVGHLLMRAEVFEQLGVGGMRDILAVLCAHLTDDNDIVSASAFKAIGRLLPKDRASHGKFFFWANAVAGAIFDGTLRRFEELVLRAQTLPIELRHVCLYPLASMILETDRSITGDVSSLLCLFVTPLLFPLLQPEMPSVTLFEASSVMIELVQLSAISNEQRAVWVQSFHDAHIALLQREGSCYYANRLVNPLANTLSFILDESARLNAIIRMSEHVQLLPSIQERLNALVPLANAVAVLDLSEFGRMREIERKMRKGAPSQQSRRLLSSDTSPFCMVYGCPWMKHSNKPDIRDEVAATLLFAMTNAWKREEKLLVSSTELDTFRTVWANAACDALYATSECLLWNYEGRTFAADAYLELLCLASQVVEQRFADRRHQEGSDNDYDTESVASDASSPGVLPMSPGRSSRSGQTIQKLLLRLLEQYNEIPASGVRTRAVGACCRYIDFSSGSSTAQRRADYLLRVIRARCLDGFSSHHRASIIRTYHNEGKPFPTAAVLPEREPFRDTEFLTRALVSLGLRCEALTSQVISLIDDLLKSKDADISIRDTLVTARAHIKYAQKNPYEGFDPEGSKGTPLLGEIMGAVFDGGVDPSVTGGGENSEFLLAYSDALSRTLSDKEKESNINGGLPDYLQRFVGPVSTRAGNQIVGSEESTKGEYKQVTGPSDPLTVRICHTSHVSKKLVVVEVEVTNNTPLELENTSVIVSLVGGIEPLHRSGQVRHEILLLKPNEKDVWEIPFVVRSFSYDVLYVSIELEHPEITASRRAEEDADEFGDDFISAEPQSIDASVPQVATNVPETEGSGSFEDKTVEESKDAEAKFGPLIVPCLPYTITPTAFLSPQPQSLQTFLRQWTGLSAVCVFVCELRKDTSITALKDALLGPGHFALAGQRYFCGETVLQASYAARTWFDEYLLMSFTGAFDPNLQQYILWVEMRSSSSSVLDVIRNDSEEWLKLLTAGLLSPTAESIPTVFSRTKLDHPSTSLSGIFAAPAVSDVIMNRWNELRSKGEEESNL